MVVFIAVPAIGVVLSLLYLYHIRPDVIVDVLGRLHLYSSGLKQRSVDGQGMHWSYLERGQPDVRRPSLLLIHGYSSNKENWIDLCKKLPADLHIVVPDLPGHGSSGRMSLEGNIYHSYSAKLHQFVQLVQLDKKKFHLTGLSMGGAIVLQYSALYPHMVAGVSTLCPAIKTPIASKMTLRIESGEHPVLTDYTVDGIRRMLDMCLYDNKPLPTVILRGALMKRRSHKDFAEKLWSKITSGDSEKYMEELRRVSPPAQVIWGLEDEILHVSGANVLKEHLPNVVQYHLLDKCGHAINMQLPKRLAGLLMSFNDQQLHSLGTKVL